MVAIDPSTTQVGTENAGYRIVCPPRGRALHVEGWGYWTPELAQAFGRDVTAACRTVLSPLGFVFDATRLKPQGREGQEALRSLLGCLARLELSGATVGTTNILAKMQLVRLAKECGVESRLQIRDQTLDAELARERAGRGESSAWPK